MVIKLKNLRISGARTGIKVDGPVDIDAENVTFDNVQQPWDVRGARSAKIRGTRIRNDPKLKSEGGKKRSFSGWHPGKNGPPLLVFCPNCKSIFPSKNYNFSGTYFNNWDNEEPCPECLFEHAKLSEGIFNLAGETIRVLSAPDMTFATLAALKDIAADVIAGKIEPETAAAKVEQISQAAARFWRKALKHGRTVFRVVGTIIALYYARESVLVGKQQVEIGKEQLKLQNDAKTDAILTQILDEMKANRFTSQGVKNQEPNPQAHGEHSAHPTKGKSPEEPVSNKLKSERKLKARELRRKALKAHREEFGTTRTR
jgi:hypothetical protein